MMISFRLPFHNIALQVDEIPSGTYLVFPFEVYDMAAGNDAFR